MSSSIDERVVQMKFNNDGFEQGVKETLSSLNKLKDGMNFDGMSKSLDTIASRFTNLGIVGTTVLTNIVNSAVNAGKSIISALTIDPITTGFSEYEEKINNIQTTMVNTGASMSTVNEALDDLNHYADKTIYKFSDMTSALGKFTAGGVDLETASNAIKGIGNAAAMAGAQASEAGRAYYNIAQAYSTGALKLVDWKSLENANIATKQLKEQFIEAGLACGTLYEANEKYYTVASDTEVTWQSLRDTLSDGWITVDVMNETFGAFADTTTELGQQAYSAAQDVKTLTQMYDTLKEAAQSGWGETWQIIIGDFEQAKEFWGQVNKEISAVLDNASDARNSLLSETFGEHGLLISDLLDWPKDLGASQFTKLADAITDVAISEELLEDKKTGVSGLMELASKGELTKSFLESVLDTLNSSNDVLQDMSTNAEDYATVAYGAVSDTVTDLQTLLHELGLYEIEIDGIFGTVTQAGVKQLQEQNNLAVTGIANTETWAALLTEVQEQSVLTEEEFEKFKEIVDNIKPTGQELLHDSILDIIVAAKKAGSAIKEAFGESFPITSEGLYTILESFKEFTATLELTDDQCKLLSTTFQGLFDIVGIYLDIITALAEILLDTISGVIDGLGLEFLNLGSSVGGTISNFREWLKTNNLIVDAAKIISKWIVKLSEKIGTLVSNIKKTEAVQNVIEKVKAIIESFKVDGYAKKLSEFWDKFKQIEWVANLLEKLEKIFNKVKEAFNSFINDPATALSNLKKSLSDFANSSNVVNLLEDLKTGFNSVWEAIKNFFKDPQAAITTLKSLTFDDILKSLESVREKIKTWGDKVSKDLSGIIEDIFTTLGLLGKDSEEADKTSSSLKETFTKIYNSLDGDTLLEKIKNLVTLFIRVTVLVKLIIGTIQVIKDLKILLDGLSGIMKAVKQYIKAAAFAEYTEGAKNLASAVAQIILALAALAAVQKMGGDIEAAGQMVFDIVLLFILLVAVFTRLNGTGLEGLASGGGLFLLAAVLVVLATGINKILDIDMNEVKQKITNIIFAIGMLVVLALIVVGANALMKTASSALWQFGIAMAGIGAGLYLIAAAIEKLSGMSWEEMSGAVQAIKTVMFMIAVLLVASIASGKNAIKAGVMILLISVALLLIAGVVSILALIPQDNLTKAIEAIRAIMWMVALLIAVTALTGQVKLSSVLVLAVVMLMLLEVAEILLALGTVFEGDEITQITEGLTLLILGIVALMAVMTKMQVTNIGKAIAALAIAMIAIGLLGLCLKLLCNGIDNPDAALPIAEGLLLLALAMIPLMAAIVLAGIASAIAGEAIAGLAIAIIVLGLLGLCMQLLCNNIDNPDSATEIAKALLLFVGDLLAVIVVCALAGVLSIGVAAGLLAIIEIAVTIGLIIVAFEKLAMPSLLSLTADLVTVGENLSKFAEALEPFKSIFDDKMISAFDCLSSAMKSFTGSAILDTLGNFITDGIEKIFGKEDDLSNLEKFFSQLPPLAAYLNEFSTNLGSNFSASKVSAAADAMAALSDMTTTFTGVKDLIEEINDTDSETLGKKTTDISDSLVGLFTGFNEISGFGNIGSNIETMATAFSSFETAVDGFSEILNKKNDFSNLGEFFSNLAPLGTYMNEFSVNLGSNFSSSKVISATEAIEAISNVSDSFKDIKTVIEKLEDMDPETAGEHATKLADVGTHIFRFGKSLSSFDKYFDEEMGDAFDVFQKAINAISKTNKIEGLDTLFEELPTIGTYLKEFSANLGTGFAPSRVSAAAEALTALAGVTGDFTDVKNLIDKISQTDTTDLATKTADISTSLLTMFTDLSSIDDISSSVDETLSHSLDAVRGYDPTFKEEGRTLMSQLCSGILVYSTTIETATNIVLKHGLEKAQSYVSDFYDTGYYIVFGLCQGVTNNSYLFSNAITTMVNSGITAAKTAADINSPSRVFARIGMYMDLGLAKGITDYSDLPEDAISSMGDSVVQDFNTLVANIDEFQDPVIRPTLDLSTLQSQARQLNGMINGSSIGLNGYAGNSGVNNNMSNTFNVTNMDKATMDYFINRMNYRLGASI